MFDRRVKGATMASLFNSSMRYRLIFILSILHFVLGVSTAGAQLNLPPEMIDGRATSGSGGDNFLFNTTWQDPDGDLVVDVTIRFRNAKSKYWHEVTLPWTQGSIPPRFGKSLIVDGPEGLYTYQFRASDAQTEDGPRLHTTPWLDGGVFYLNQGIIRRNCIGTAWDQPFAVPGTKIPEVTIHAPKSVQEDAEVLLTASVLVDEAAGAWPSLIWCTDRGYLELLSGDGDYRAVRFIAPRAPGASENARITVDLADMIGYVAFDEAMIEIQDRGLSDPADPAPTVEFTPPSVVNVNQTNVLFAQLSDVDSLGNDTSESVSSDILVSHNSKPFESIVRGKRGATIQHSWFPVGFGEYRIRVVASDGNGSTVVESESILTVGGLSFRGQVVDEETLEGLAGVDIEFRFNKYTAITEISSTDGGFGTTSLPEGLYTITPSLKGYLFTPASIERWLTPAMPIEDVYFHARIDDGTDGGSSVVSIDIKPGSEENPINCSSNGKIPVAILSSDSFNAASDTNQRSLRFGHSGNEESLHYRGNGEPNCSGGRDHNGDGILDLLCHFNTQQTGFQREDTEGILRGQTLTSRFFEGRDRIRIVGSANCR